MLLYLLSFEVRTMSLLPLLIWRRIVMWRIVLYLHELDALPRNILRWERMTWLVYLDCHLKDRNLSHSAETMSLEWTATLRIAEQYEPVVPEVMWIWISFYWKNSWRRWYRVWPEWSWRWWDIKKQEMLCSWYLVVNCWLLLCW